jgi:hypothetical protein
MALATERFEGSYSARRFFRYSDASAANTELVLTVPAGAPFRVLSVEARYSESVTKSVTVVRDSGVAAAYDSTLTTIAISSAAAGTYLPSVPPPCAHDDALVVTAAAGGSGVTCALTVYVERL